MWENIVLIAAASEAEAFQKAEELGRDDEGDDDGTFRWGAAGPVGFRRCQEAHKCALQADRPEDGDEISSLEFEFKTNNDVKRFVAGKPTEARIDEAYREIEVDESGCPENQETSL